MPVFFRIGVVVYLAFEHSELLEAKAIHYCMFVSK